MNINKIEKYDLNLFDKQYTTCQREVCTTLDEIMVTKFKV